MREQVVRLPRSRLLCVQGPLRAVGAWLLLPPGLRPAWRLQGAHSLLLCASAQGRILKGGVGS